MNDLLDTFQTLYKEGDLHPYDSGRMAGVIIGAAIGFLSMYHGIKAWRARRAAAAKAKAAGAPHETPPAPASGSTPTAPVGEKLDTPVPKELEGHTQKTAEAIEKQGGEKEVKNKLRKRTKKIAKDASAPKREKPRRIRGPKLKPGTPEHKALRWQQYQQRGGTWSYERWSNTYEANINRARLARIPELQYQADLGWSDNNYLVQEGGVVRKLDVADPLTRRGAEVKAYRVSLSADIRSEIDRDSALIAYGWELHWYLKGGADSGVIKLLEDSRIPYVIGD